MTRLVVAVVLTGCFSPSLPAGRPCSAAGECPDGLVCSAQNTCEQSLTDAPRPDAATDARNDATTDAAIDAAIDAPPGPQLVAHYRFDGTLADVTGAHPATPNNSPPVYVPGSSGQAVRITASGPVRVADSPAFDLPSGRIELHVRYDAGAPDGDLGLFSRDAVGSSTAGHFNLRLGHDRRLVLRIQRLSDPTDEALRCTAAPLTADIWHHVDATFGPGGLVLRVDGVIASGTTWTSTGNVVFDCTRSWTLGIAGNDNPIAIGALTILSVEGTGLPTTALATDVELDDVKIWSLP